MKHPLAEAIFEEFGVKVVEKNVIPAVGETRAVATLQRIINRHGQDHARFVIMALAGCANNKAALDETGIWATSDIILAFRKNYPEIMENDVTRFLEFFDRVPVGMLQYWCFGLDGITNKRAALVGLLWERACRTFGDRQGQLFGGRAA
ncbi:hypothetical protein ABID21_003973 [Pseudorhizobium tarimense]|uniref:Uncharacterized protein n=1 Tax=Pseudorhizobium tarimense TaxID=1079109 RepID=A0ABV2HCC6_9HYPH|nr:hypothetical protein [Pseudorhizobium tarimense]MCJ8520750.1 hypothetical protein [Pseudorhizobium tarimense]